MTGIKSPLGALGALMVFLQGILAAALVPLSDHPDLQRIIVWLMVGATSLITVSIVGIVVGFAWKKPYLLFAPGEFHESVQNHLFKDRSDVPPKEKAPPAPPNILWEGTVTMPILPPEEN